MQFSQEELALRRNIITASEAAGIMGISKHPSKIESYNWHVNGVRTEVNNVYTELGTYNEPWVARRFVERYFPGQDVKLLDPREMFPDTFGIMIHPDYPWIGATPDRIIPFGEWVNCPVELKFIGNPQTIAEYSKEDGSFKIPLRYDVQCVVQLAVARAFYAKVGAKVPEVGYHFAYLGGDERGFPLYWEEAEPKWKEILAHLIAFREDYWLPAVPPPPDSSEDYTNFLLQQRSAVATTKTVRDVSDPGIDDLYLNMVAAGELEKRAKAIKRFYMNSLAVHIGEDKGIKTQYGSLQVVGGKERKETDWHAVADALLHLVDPEDWKQAVDLYTRTFNANESIRPYKKRGLTIELDMLESGAALLLNPPAQIESEEGSDE